MLQDRQIDRMVQKVARLEQIYSAFLIKKTIKPKVMMEKNGKVSEIKKGQRWGEAFKCATFAFVCDGLDEDEKYYVYAESGAPEHLVLVNGKKVGMLDYITDAYEPPARTHRYLLLEGLKNGDTVTLEAYYSHTIPGIMPYDDPFTFSYFSLHEDRSYDEIGLVVLNQPLKAFCDKLGLLTKLYNSTKSATEKAEIEKVYLELFKILPFEKEEPNEEAILHATEVIADFFAAEKKLPYVGVVGHSHLDTAWLWTVEETRRKLMRTVSNAVTLLKRHEEYKFFMSTVLYLKWIEEDDPALFAEVKKLVAEGRMELNGSTWVECDGNLTGSEAFCRHFLRGKRYLREKFGYESDTFWLPDTFGYSAALPQIMKQSNVNYFLTTKLSWNDTNNFPYETFMWRGIDGSQVPVHFNSIHTWIDEESVANRLNNLHDPRESDCVLMAYGFGDGGGGPSEEMVSRAIFTQQHARDVKVEHTTVSDFMKKISAKELPTYFGELYLELHRGTYTSIHQLKMYNRRLEEALHNAELISVLRSDAAAKETTDRLYDVLMLNQFHDILPGTCIAEATDIAIGEQKAALKEAGAYSAGKGRKKYFNTLPYERTEILPAPNGQTYEALDGKRTVAPYKFDAFGFGKVRKRVEIPFAVAGDVIKTPYLTVVWKEGSIASLVYEGRELVKDGFNLIKCYEDMPYIYDNWDIDADYPFKEKKVTFLGREVVSIGEYLLVVRVKHAVADHSVLETDIKFRYDSPVVEFENRLTFGDKHTLLRAEFDSTLFAPTYKCETQFGYVERNCFPRDKSDIAKFEVCSHKWTDLSEYGMGISLLSDCKYGVSCAGGKLGITLHKSGTHPDARGDNGVSIFRYAIYPHLRALGMDTIRQAYGFNYAPVATAHRDITLPFALRGGETVVMETVKYGEDDGIVLRLYEAMGATSCATLTADNREIIACNILEDEGETLGRGKAEIAFAPFEIKTIKLK
ncbi:MAG: alpha-mannosidase [Ruminococcaceae bacterium]|nr:alpha-mannosidase [Oscillospiraceae bacterium]